VYYKYNIPDQTKTGEIMTIMETITLLLTGTLFGSFFHTLALRYINSEIKENPIKALFSFSKCPSCEKKINPFFLIPILGYILLLGKCKNCKSRIPLHYPAAEIIYALALIAVAGTHGISIYSLNIFLLICVSFCIAEIDIKTMLIPDSLIIVFIVFTVYPVILSSAYLDSLYGFLLMFLFFVTILLLFPGSFGGGDIKFASASGILFGLELSAVVLETALITGAITGIAYALWTKKGLRTKIPFGPFITIGIITAFLFGRKILLLYYSSIM